MRFQEDELTVCCVQWFRTQYKNRVIFHIPNGGKRNAREAGRLKKMGVLSGASDFFIPEPNKFSNGLFVELKIKPNKPTDNQKKFLAQMGIRGYTTEICYSLQDFMKVVRDYFNLENVKGDWEKKAQNAYIC